MMLAILICSLALLESAAAFPNPKLISSTFQRCYWSGWPSVKYMFVFGDSYTTTGFDVKNKQPTIDNPFGNPDYPGTANANGPNWIEWLATAHNKSNIRVVNLSNGGATVDTDLVQPFTSSVLSLKQQVEDLYLPQYSNATDEVPWDRSDTLFTFWMGLNDVSNTGYDPNSTLYTDIFTVYSSLVERVYSSGARNILLMNAPPVDKAPKTVEQGNASVLSTAAGVADFNTRLSAMAANLTKTHKDAKVFLFDSGFNKILDDPCSFDQTCSIEYTTTTCDAYLDGHPDWPLDKYDESCKVPIDGYFWLNALHPTTVVHNATAQYIADQLTAAKPCYRR